MQQTANIIFWKNGKNEKSGKADYIFLNSGNKHCKILFKMTAHHFILQFSLKHGFLVCTLEANVSKDTSRHCSIQPKVDWINSQKTVGLFLYYCKQYKKDFRHGIQLFIAKCSWESEFPLLHNSSNSLLTVSCPQVWY